MPEIGVNIQNPLVKVSACLPKGLELKPALDPLSILEGQYASGKHLKVVGLANCIGVGIVKDIDKTAVAAHIGPFSGEKHSEIPQIDAWANLYIDQVSIGITPPSLIIMRSREIGSRPLFHGRMLEILKKRFPEATIDIKNGTEFEIQLQ